MNNFKFLIEIVLIPFFAYIICMSYPIAHKECWGDNPVQKLIVKLFQLIVIIMYTAVEIGVICDFLLYNSIGW